MEIRAFTEAIADTAIRYQITLMDNSVMIWVQQASAGGGSGATGSGSLPYLAVSMPAVAGYDGLPAATTILHGRDHDVSSERMASRLARRCGIPIYACIDLGDVANVAADIVFRRLVRELEAAGIASGSSSSTRPL